MRYSATTKDLFGGFSTRFFDEQRTVRKPAVEENEDSTPGQLCWGAPNDIPEPDYAVTTGFVVTSADEVWTETDRESDTVRIENPEDSSQYVEVERPSQINYTKVTEDAPYSGNVATTIPEGIDEHTYPENFQPANTPKTKTTKATQIFDNGPTTA